METTERTPSEAELMMQAYEALKKLPREAQEPAVKWLSERLMIPRSKTDRFPIGQSVGPSLTEMVGATGFGSGGVFCGKPLK